MTGHLLALALAVILTLAAAVLALTVLAALFRRHPKPGVTGLNAHQPEITGPPPAAYEKYLRQEDMHPYPLTGDNAGFTRWGQFMDMVGAVQATPDYIPHEPCADCYITDDADLIRCIIHDQVFWDYVRETGGMPS